jgi:hypothetical protein
MLPTGKPPLQDIKIYSHPGTAYAQDGLEAVKDWREVLYV